MVKAASDAVSQSHFGPRIGNGKPIAAYAHVRVNFAVTLHPAATSPQAKASPII